MQDEEQRPLRAGADVEGGAGEPAQALEAPHALPEPAPLPSAPPAVPPPERLWDERGRTTLVINLASVMERVDEQLLPALYSRVGASFAADPEQVRHASSLRHPLGLNVSAEHHSACHPRSWAP